MRPMGHSTYTEELAAEICERIADGETLRAICREDGKPTWSTVYQWLRDRPEFAARMARARDLGYDAIAEETIEILDERPERTATEHGDKVDAGYVAWQKNRAWQRMQLLAKWSPKKYGEKLEVAGNVAVELSLTERLAAARRRTTKPDPEEDDGSDLAG